MNVLADTPVEELRRELALLEEKVLTQYTLADAIREGASVTKPLTGGYITETESCALGAAWVAAKARGYIK